ncbi:MAG TPA: CsiV family protein, partial [Gammaproteobacteria bacterium]|nr:CsiV family protein [Gammaproteobacteria bacterium]
APQASQVVSLRQPQAGASQPYTMLGNGELKLGSVYKSLRDSQRYQPLLHIGWRQPGLAGNQTASVAIPPNWQPWADGARPPLYGLVRFQQDRFLHVAVDLRYYQPSSGTVVTAGGGAAPEPTYVHQQSRRIRTGELHYLDHATLGVIVQVRPLAGS